MHPTWAMFLRVLLWAHIASGGVAFVCAPVALVTAKGGRTHRRWGKIYFWAMAGVAGTGSRRSPVEVGERRRRIAGAKRLPFPCEFLRNF